MAFFPSRFPVLARSFSVTAAHVSFCFYCFFKNRHSRLPVLGDIGRSPATIDSNQLYTICLVTFRLLDDVIFVTLGFRNIWRRKSRSYYVVILGCLMVSTATLQLPDMVIVASQLSRHIASFHVTTRSSSTRENKSRTCFKKYQGHYASAPEWVSGDRSPDPT